MGARLDLQPHLKDYLRLGWAGLKLLIYDPSLIWRCLPRSWRGGYTSPWDEKKS